MVEDFDELPVRRVDLRPEPVSHSDSEAHDQSHTDESAVVSSLPGIFTTRETPAQRRERWRSIIAAIVAGVWSTLVVFAVVAIVADWTTWDEIKDPFSLITPIVAAIIGYYFGSE